MSISFSEQLQLTCFACGTAFSADAWVLVDAAEHPELAADLRAGTLNIVVCPSCGQQQPAGAPLLFHDGINRRVYFAVPPAVEEHLWREQAQELLRALVSSLPEDQRRAYLGDVQVDQELDGVRRAVLRRDRLRGRAAATQPAQATPVVREPAADPAPATRTPDPLLVEAVRELLGADSEAQFAQVLALNPDLASERGDALVRQLAELAYGEGDRSVGEALDELRATLARRRSGAGDQPQLPERGGPAAQGTEDRPLEPHNPALSDSAYQALLNVAARNELEALTRDFPELLGDWANADLTRRVELALEEGNERLARVIEVRREALSELRSRSSRPT